MHNIPKRHSHDWYTYACNEDVLYTAYALSQKAFTWLQWDLQLFAHNIPRRHWYTTTACALSQKAFIWLINNLCPIPLYNIYYEDLLCPIIHSHDITIYQSINGSLVSYYQKIFTWLIHYIWRSFVQNPYPIMYYSISHMFTFYDNNTHGSL